MKATLLLAGMVLATTGSLASGELHGRVACKGLRNSADAVVYVTSIPGKTFAAPDAHAQIRQSHTVFVPHVLPVIVGTTVEFLNQDNVLHNVFSPDPCAPRFNLGTWPRGQVRQHAFTQECAAAILCNVHPEMEAFVVAVPTPYFAVTAPDGSYLIPNVPDGTYTVKVWHQKLKAVQKSIHVQGTTEASFEMDR